ncbi:anthranilate synthase component I family protein, partial [Nonlabens mediterrranea]|nr:anthranilate synthase component I family protein [Nonlabens mediterrranea]
MHHYKAKSTQQTILADMLTPVAIYMRLRDKYPGSILLESNEYGERSNSYSFICCNPVAQFSVTNTKIESQFPDGTIEHSDFSSSYDLASGLTQFKNSFKHANTDLPFPNHGLFGYLGFDAVQLFESLEFRFRESDNNIPLAHYQVFQNVMVFDHYHNQLHVFEHLYDGKNSNMRELLSVIKHKDVAQYSFETSGDETSEMTDENFQNLVEKGKEHRHDGNA